MTESIASEWLEEGCPAPYDSQIAKEIGYFVNFYQDISPKVFLSYEREAFYPEDGSDIRITLDSNIIARDYDLSLQKGVYGRNILDRDLSVLEVKVSETMPTVTVRIPHNAAIRPEGAAVTDSDLPGSLRCLTRSVFPFRQGYRSCGRNMN